LRRRASVDTACGYSISRKFAGWRSHWPISNMSFAELWRAPPWCGHLFCRHSAAIRKSSCFFCRSDRGGHHRCFNAAARPVSFERIFRILLYFGATGLVWASSPVRDLSRTIPLSLCRWDSTPRALGNFAPDSYLDAGPVGAVRSDLSTSFQVRSLSHPAQCGATHGKLMSVTLHASRVHQMLGVMK